MKAVRELKKELFNLYSRKQIEHRDIIFIFGKVREILEHRGNYKSAFPQLNLFCNWCFHTSLKSSKTIYRYLLDVSIAISKAATTSNNEEAKETTNNLVAIGANILNIPQLRIGLKEVLTEQGIDATICNNREWWNACVQLLLYEISEKPLQFPEDVVTGQNQKGDAYKFFSQILQLPHSRDFDKVIRLEVKLDEKENQYKLHFSTLANVTYVVNVHGMEPESAFAP